MEEKINQNWDGNLFNNEYQDRVLNLTHEKTRRGKSRKYIKRHEKTREETKNTS